MNSKNRAMALLLSVFMTMTYMPSFAFADTAESSDTTSTTETQTGENQNESAQAESSESGQKESSQAESKDVRPQTNDEENAGEEANNSAADGVAVIGENSYASLAEAIQAAKSGDTITLKKDVAEDVTIPADKDITLDTAKHTLTNVKSHTITIAYGGKLTVGGAGTIDNITNGKTPMYNNGTVVLKDVTVIRSKTKSNEPNKNSYYSILNRGEMTIDGATVKAENDNFSSLVENGYFNYKNEYKEGNSAKNPKLHIKNGTFSGGLNTIKNDDGGEVVIDDGTFTNIAQAVVMNWNVATINGGTYETELAGIHNGKYDDSIDKGELTINGGTFKTKNLVCNTFTDSKIGTVTIKGGNFTAVEKMYGGNAQNDASKADAAKKGIQVAGGTFQSKDVIADYVAEGFAPSEKEDGSIGVEDTTIVATVGDNSYKTLEEAIQAAKSGDTITLKKDVAEDVTIPADKDITLDTAKHTLTNVKEDTITVKHGGKLTVVGGGTIDNIVNGKTPIRNNGTVVLKNVTVTRSKTKADNPDKNSYYCLLNNGEMIIDGATVKTENDNFSSLVENGYFDYASGYKEGTNAKNPKLHIKNGTFSGGLNTIKNDDGGELVIDDGTFTNIAQAVVMNWNVATINGGTFETELAGIHNGKYDDSIDKGELTINGGTFKTKNLVCNTFKNSKLGTVTIKGGNFTAVDKMYGGNQNNDTSKADAAKKGIQISGGTFQSKDVIADYVAEGFAPSEKEDGSIGIEESYATIGDQSYKTLAAAIQAAKSGDTITLVQDVAEDVTIPADKDITLDTAKHALTNVKEDTITVKHGGKLTIIGGGTIDNITNGKASVSNNGTVLIKDVTVIRSKTKSNNPNKNSFYSILNHGEMTIDGATVKAENDNFSSLIENGYQNYNNQYKEGTNAKNPTLHIKSGIFSGGLNTIKNDDGGEVVIDGGTFTNIAQVAVMNWNKATINGGTFEGKEANFFNGKYDDVIDNGELTIKGGTFKSTTLVTNSQSGSTIGTITIKGGDFTAVDKMYEGSQKADSVKKGIQVTGGTYKNKDVVADYTKDGYAPSEKEDGTVGITVDDQYIEDLKKDNEAKAEAIAKAEKELSDTQATLESTKGELETKRTELATATSDLEKKNQELTKAQEDLEATGLKLKAAQDELSEKDQALSDAQKQLADAKSEASTSKAELAEKEKALAKAKDDLTEAQNNLTETKKTLQAREDALTTVQGQLTEAQGKVSDLEKQLSDKETALNQVQSNLDNANIALDTARKEIAKKDADLSAIQKELSAANDSLAQANDELTTTKGALAEAEKLLDSKDKALTEATKKLGETETTLNNTKSELDATKKALDAANTLVESLKEQLKNAETERDQAKDKAEELQNKLTTAEGERDALQKKYDNLDSELTTVKGQLQAASDELETKRNELSTATDNLKTAREELQTEKDKVAAKEAEVNKLNDQLLESKNSEIAKGEELSNALTQLGDAKEKLAEAETNLKNKEEALDTANKKLEEAQDKVSDMQKQLDEKENALSDTQNKLDKATDALEAANAEITKKDADLDAVQKKLDAANNSLTDVNKELATTKGALSEAEKILATKEEALDSAQKELADTKAALKTSQDELQATKDKLAEASKELEKKSAELDAAQKELKETKDALEKAQKELADAKAALEKANKTIAQMKIKNPAKVTGLKVKAGKKKVSVSYKKVASAQGYTLKISKSKKFSKAKKYGTKTITIKQGKTVKKTVTKLSSKKTYYVKVRAWKKVNGKTYTGKWSSVKKIKVK